MFKALAKGYGAVAALAVIGYVSVGGPVWIWVCGAWLVAAPVTLFLVSSNSPEAEQSEEPSRSSLTWDLKSMVRGPQVRG